MLLLNRDVYLFNIKSHVIIEYNEDNDEDLEVYEILFNTLKFFFRNVNKLLLYCFNTI